VALARAEGELIRIAEETVASGRKPRRLRSGALCYRGPRPLRLGLVVTTGRRPEGELPQLVRALRKSQEDGGGRTGPLHTPLRR
jgi:hypothetical protein